MHASDIQTTIFLLYQDISEFNFLIMKSNSCQQAKKNPQTFKNVQILIVDIF